jgi:hypothetical protein
MAENVQEMPVNLAQQGLKVLYVARPDACRACRAMQGRIFDPLTAPALPLQECLTPPCRCRYEGYDPRSVVSRLLSAGVDAVKENRLEEARELLYQVIDLDDRNEKAWLWLSGVSTGIEERIVCLESVLAINPHHEVARQGLDHLKTQRRQLGARQSAARKIREAKEAIGHLRASQPKVMTLREAPPTPPRVPSELGVGGPTARLQPVAEPPRREEERPEPPISFPMVFLCVLLSVLLLVLILAAVLRLSGTF